MEPTAGAQGESDAASRRRTTAAHRVSHEGPIEVGGGAVSESGTDEFSSLNGDNTFTSMMKIMKIECTRADDYLAFSTMVLP